MNAGRLSERIGILGGTFNPVHHGHLILAQNAMERHELSRVLLMPCARQPQKDPALLASAEARRAMLEFAIESDPRFEVCDIELERGGITYTIDTVRELSRRYPGAELCLIIGDDTLLELHTWRAIEAVLNQVTFLIFARDLAADGLRPELLKLPPPWRERLLANVSMGRRIEISSSDIRYRVAEGLGIRYLVPDAVEMYIVEHRLYRGGC